MVNKEKLKKLIADESGNSMVEFTLVLPLLIVLTLGGVYLSVSFSQKAVMNGLTFLEVRAGSVRKNYGEVDKLAKDIWKKDKDGLGTGIGDTAENWLDKTTVKMDVSADKHQMAMRVELSKEPLNLDMLTNALSLLGGNKPTGNQKIRQIKTSMTIPYEFNERKGSGYKTDRPETYTVVDYETKYSYEKAIDSALDVLPPEPKELITKALFDKLVDPKKKVGVNDSEQADGVLSTDPKRNMEKIKAVYKKWGLEYTENSQISSGSPEKPLYPKNKILYPESIKFLEDTGDYIKIIEGGGTLLSVLNKLNASPVSPFLTGVKKVLGPSSKFIYEKGNAISDGISSYNSALFQKGVIP